MACDRVEQSRHQPILSLPILVSQKLVEHRAVVNDHRRAQLVVTPTFWALLHGRIFAAGDKIKI
jgi:hypothetical protein